MPKWYVEFKLTTGEYKYMEGIEAKDGKEAIEYVKSRYYNAYSFKVFHDDEEES